MFVGNSNVGYLTILDGDGGSGSSTVDASAAASGRKVFYHAFGGDDTYLGGDADEIIIFDAAALTAADTVTAAGGGDWLTIQNGAGHAVTAADLTGVTGVEVVKLDVGGGSVTLRNGIFGDVAYAFGTDSNDTFDASGVTDRGIGFLTEGGNDVLRGSSQSDTFIFIDATDLTSADTVHGNAGADFLQLWGGNYAADALLNVRSVETVVLNAATNITLLDTMSTMGAIVEGSSGNDVVNASNFSTLGVLMYSGGGLDTLTGGTTGDVFWFRNADLNQDVVTGGNGAALDYLVLAANGTYSSSATSSVTQIEEIQLNSGGALHVTNASVGSATGQHLVLRGSAAVDTLDASLVNGAGRVTLFSAGGADTLRGGSGNDIIDVVNGSYALVDGGDGFDILQLSGNNAALDLTAVAGKTSDIEAIDMRGAGINLLTVTRASVTAVTGGGNSLYVVGNVDDEIAIDSGWTLVATGQTNANFPGSQFHHLVNNGVNLFVENAVVPSLPPALQSNSQPVLDLSLAAPGVDFTTPTHNTGTQQTAIAAGDAFIDDPDGAQNIQQLTAVITNAVGGSGESLILTATGAGIAAGLGLSIATGTTLTVSGVATRDQYEQILAQVRYVNSDRSPPVDTATRQINVTVQDTFGDTSGVASTFVPVALGNSAPIANADAVATTEDSSVSFNVLANDTDADGDTLTISGTPTSPNGTVTVGAGGQITFTPTADFNGRTTINYAVSDGITTSNGVVDVTVAAVNDGPVANPDSAGTAEETPVTVNVAANDTDVETPASLVVTAASVQGGAAVGGVTFAGGSVTFTPALNFTGSAVSTTRSRTAMAHLPRRRSPSTSPT